MIIILVLRFVDVWHIELRILFLHIQYKWIGTSWCSFIKLIMGFWIRLWNPYWLKDCKISIELDMKMLNIGWGVAMCVHLI